MNVNEGIADKIRLSASTLLNKTATGGSSMIGLEEDTAKTQETSLISTMRAAKKQYDKEISEINQTFGKIGRMDLEAQMMIQFFQNMASA